MYFLYATFNTLLVLKEALNVSGTAYMYAWTEINANCLHISLSSTAADRPSLWCKMYIFAQTLIAYSVSYFFIG